MHPVVGAALLGENPLTINPLIGDGLIALNYPESRARVFKRNVGEQANITERGEAVNTQLAERDAGYDIRRHSRRDDVESSRDRSIRGLKPGD